MAIDVNLINAFLEENNTILTGAAYTTAFNSAFNSACSAAAAPAFQSAINQCPCAVTLWCCIPIMSGATGSINVCDVSGFFRCGAQCTWTVPSGITCAQFQLWGPGAGSMAGCCCGGGMPGGTGAYVTAIVPVSAGQIYCMCAGCSICCYPQPAGGYCAKQPPTWITGPAFCNLCAEGGTNWSPMNSVDQGCQGSTATGSGWCTHQFFPNSGTIAGPCICGSNNYCFGGSCATCGEIVVHRNFNTNYFGSTVSPAGFIYGIPGLHGGLCLDTNNFGHFTNPPVINLTHTGAFGGAPDCGCRICFTSETCLGGANCNAGHSPSNGAGNVMQFPGAGGFGQHAMGGGNSHCGDAGRMGMVRVTFK